VDCCGLSSPRIAHIGRNQSILLEHSIIILESLLVAIMSARFGFSGSTDLGLNNRMISSTWLIIFGFGQHLGPVHELIIADPTNFLDLSSTYHKQYAAEILPPLRRSGCWQAGYETFIGFLLLP
jgi:hypothetical protein